MNFLLQSVFNIHQCFFFFSLGTDTKTMAVTRGGSGEEWWKHLDTATLKERLHHMEAEAKERVSLQNGILLYMPVNNLN